MGAYLRALKVFGLRSETTTDEVLDNGQKVQFGATVDYLVRKPNGMRAEVVSDRKRRQRLGVRSIIIASYVVKGR